MHQLKNNPEIIEKRTFTCVDCGYSAQVYGGQYFDHGCRNYIVTFQCPDCHILFENIVSQRKYLRPPVPDYELADEIVCMWCGSDKVRVWNKDTDSCPKCGGKMNYTVDGEIIISFEKKNK